MTDFVYICREGFNEELRYSIRSVIQNFPDPNIWVVGGKPRWYIGQHIEVPQTGTKYENAYKNIATVLESDQIKSNFVLMNDDFFIIKPMTEIPTYHGTFLINKVKTYERLFPRSTYTYKLRNTYETIKGLLSVEPMDYELHMPMIFNKSKLAAIFNKSNTDTLYRSLYGNYYSIGGIEKPDVKIYTRGYMKQRTYRITDDTTFISSDDHSFKFKVRHIVKKQLATRSYLELD
jgi:hypothetical protein